MPRRSNDVLSVEQMAAVVGVGRQTAYAQCRLWLATDGRDGIPCHRIGRLILVYRHELETWLGFAIAWPPTEPPAPPAPAGTNASDASPASTRPRSNRRTRRVNADQATLPF